MKKTVTRTLILICIIVSGCSADITTKNIAKKELQYHSVPIIKNVFNLTFVKNTATAFGFLKQIEFKYRLPLILFVQGSIILLCLYFLWRIKHERTALVISLSILIAGALGNFTDRLLNGFVTDFLHLHYFYKYNFPVFNVADVLINVGVIFILIYRKEFHLLLIK